MQVRGTMRVRCRTAAKNNSGTLDNGNPWSNRTFEAVDEDDNKLTIRVGDQDVVEVGKVYQVLGDIESQSAVRLRITAVQIKPAA